VQNGGFEQYWHCPYDLQQIYNVKFWVDATQGSPDYFNQCDIGIANVPNPIFGYQQAHNGIAYMGIVIFEVGTSDYREYIEDTLFSPLVANVCYHFEMYINLANTSIYTSSNIGVYFSDTLINTINYFQYFLPISPQINNSHGNFPDTLNWTLVSGDYMAVGGERYLTIGNFNNDLSLDSSLVNPTESEAVSYFYIDDVSLTAISCTTEGITTYTNTLEVNVFPNPVTTSLTITTTTTEETEVTLYDVTSRKLMQQRFVNTTTLNTEGLAKGVYLYQLKNKNGLIKEGKVVKE
jgi:hypothetical protein